MKTQLVALGSVSETVMGQAPPGADCNKSGRGTAFVKAGEFSDLEPIIREWTTNPLKFAEKGDVLVCVVGATAGKINLGIDCAIGRSVAAVRPNSKRLDTAYLHYFLRTRTDRLRALSQGLAQGVITREMLSKLEIPLPPLDEQRRIASILDKADALRRKRKRVLELLEELTKALFLEMFGSYLNRTPNIVLEKFADIQVGFPFKSSNYSEQSDSIRLCRGANVLPGRMDWSDLARWPNKQMDEFSEFGLRSGDIVIAMDRPWISSGFKAARISSDDLPSLLVQRVARIRPTVRTDGDFLYALVQSSLFSGHFKPTETTVPHISPVEIKKFSFALPPIVMRERFAALSAKIHYQLTAAADDLTKRNSLFFSLQHRAFCGQL